MEASSSIQPGTGESPPASGTPAKDAAAAASQPAPSAPAKKTRYKIYLAVPQAKKVKDLALPDAGKGLANEDLVFLGAQAGHTREAGVGALLDEGSGSASPPAARLAKVREHVDAGKALSFSVVAEGSLGTVPVEVEIQRKRKIGG